MKQFLFPTNFSEESKNALEFAYHFTAKRNKQLVLFNSYYSTESPRRTLLENGTRYDETIKKLNQFSKESRVDSKPPILLRAKEGYVIRNIIEYSKRPRVEMVMMSRSNTYEWIDRWLGTRLSYVCTGSFKPTLIIPPSYSYKDIKKVFIRDNDNKRENSYVLDLLYRIFPESQMDFSYDSSFHKGKANSKILSSSIFSSLAKLKPGRYTRNKKNILKRLKKVKPDLFILVLKDGNVMHQLMEKTIILPMILDLSIPTLVINQNTIESQSLRMISLKDISKRA